MIFLDKKNYITRGGLKNLQAELQSLKNIRLQKVREPENEEEVDFIDVRMGEIQEVLSSYELITVPPKDKRDEIKIGATIMLVSGGKKKEITIVGKVEANPLLGFVSNESPAGRTLLGKKIGDSVSLNQKTKEVFKIEGVSYNNLGVREA